MELMNWLDIQSKMAEGYTTVIIPIGSIEQHGPHLPLNADVLIGEVIAERTAEILSKSLVAPAIRPGCSEHHMEFPGTLTISAELLTRLVYEYCRSYVRHGFRTIVLLPSHGGNFAVVKSAAEQLKQDYADQGVKIVSLDDLARLFALSCQALAPYGYTPQHVGGHAGAGETTVVLAIQPQLVRQERYQKGYTGDEFNLEKLLVGGMKRISQNGVLGDPRGATAEMGEKVVTNIAEAYAKQVRQDLAEDLIMGTP